VNRLVRRNLLVTSEADREGEVDEMYIITQRRLDNLSKKRTTELYFCTFNILSFQLYCHLHRMFV
jgi:hypothetical protein